MGIYWDVIRCGKMYWILNKRLTWQSFIGWCKTWVLHPILIEFNLKCTFSYIFISLTKSLFLDNTIIIHLLHNTTTHHILTLSSSIFWNFVHFAVTSLNISILLHLSYKLSLSYYLSHTYIYFTNTFLSNYSYILPTYISNTSY